jgi:hypothetical protein
MKKLLQILFWIVLLIPIYVWGDSFAWDFSILSLFLLFPLLGLLAFSVMWTQVFVGAFEKHIGKYFNLGRFYAKTGLAVLILFVSHPLIALIALWNATGSANPFNLISESQAVYLILAMIAFATFIAFEITLRWKHKTIQRFKPWVENASAIGVILVWIHSINIGSHTQGGWFMYLWWFYGITGVLMIAYSFWHKLRKVKQKA